MTTPKETTAELIHTWRSRQHPGNISTFYKNDEYFAEYAYYNTEGGSILSDKKRNVIPLSETRLSTKAHRRIAHILDKWDNAFMFLEYINHRIYDFLHASRYLFR